MDLLNGLEATAVNVVSLRRLPDWIEGLLDYSEGVNSPEIFRKWTAIATVAGALERRVWVKTARAEVYPNLYTLLVAPPGIGKNQAIDHATDLWLAVRDLKVAPDSVTKAALVDAVQDAKRTFLPNPTTLVEFSALLVSAPELGILLPAHDLEFLNTLNVMFDNPKFYREKRRHQKDNPVEILRPQLNILAGTQPGYLAALLPEEAWSMGFMSRMIMIYSREVIKVELFNETHRNDGLYKDLIYDLKSVAKLYGEFTFEEAAQKAMSAWHRAGGPPAPEHSKLEHYSTRRTLHILKLSMIASASRGNSMIVTLDDLQKAWEWLFEAEDMMPDIFKDMIHKSDSQVIQDLHFHIWKLYARDKKPIHESRLIHFLQTKVPSEKIIKILEIADKANIISRVAGTTNLWIPKPKSEQGLE